MGVVALMIVRSHLSFWDLTHSSIFEPFGPGDAPSLYALAVKGGGALSDVRLGPRDVRWVVDR